MSILSRYFLISLALVLLATVAHAQTRILGTDDPLGYEIRPAAGKLLLSIANGDLDTARALFDGPDDQAVLLRAEIDCVGAAKSLKQALDSRFPSLDDRGNIEMSDVLRAQIGLLTKRSILVNGDRASIEAGALTASGMELHRVAGQWKVTHLTACHGNSGAMTDFYREFTSALKTVQQDVTSGKISSRLGAENALNERMKPTMVRIVRPPRAAPSTVPIWPRPLRASELRELITEKTVSTKLVQVIAEIPSMPWMWRSSFATFINWEELGLSVSLDARGTTLNAILLYAQGVDGYGQYRGELPSGLAFGQRRKDVEKNLGSPVRSAGGEDYWAEYPHLGISVTYLGRSSRDPESVIQQIALFPEDKSAPSDTVDATRISFRLVAQSDDDNAAVENLIDPDVPKGGEALRIRREVLIR
jgi:hypothetical protein